MDIFVDIKELVEALIETNDVKYASQIKRRYKMYISEQRTSGKLNEAKIKVIARILLENYDEIKEYIPINEVMQLIAEDYNILAQNSKNIQEKEDLQNKRLMIHVKALGNPGSSSKGLSIEYIEKVIRRKIDNNIGINREDIINILKEQSENMYMDLEAYQKLIEDVLMPLVDLEITENQNKLKNPKIEEILLDLARSYKTMGEYEKSKEICDKGLKLVEFQGTVEYKELEEESKKINEILSLIHKDFEQVDISRVRTAEELEKIIRMHLGAETIDIDIFPTGKSSGGGKKGHTGGGGHPVAKELSVKEKCIAIFALVKDLQKDNPNIRITRLQVGKNSFHSYVMLPLDNTNITLLENFNKGSNAIYIIENENIEQLSKCKKDFRQLSGVEFANHGTGDEFEDYIERLIKKTRLLVFNTRQDRDELDYEVDDDIEEIEDLSALSEEELIEISSQVDSDIKEITEEAIELTEEAGRLRKESIILDIISKMRVKGEKEAEIKKLRQEIKKLKLANDERKNNTKKTGEAHDEDE